MSVTRYAEKMFQKDMDHLPCLPFGIKRRESGYTFFYDFLQGHQSEFSMMLDKKSVIERPAARTI